MINFRFHLVSLTAVFLALAAGIAIGAGVVDRQTVGFLERRLEDVERNRQETITDNDALRADLQGWATFADQLGDQPVQGRLTDVGVLVFAADGTDRASVETLRNTVVAAGGSVRGVVWLTGRWSLDDEEEIEDLTRVVGAASSRQPDQLRGVAIERLVFSWAAGNLGEVAIPLRDLGFLEFNPTPGAETAFNDVALTGTTMLVVGARATPVPNRSLTLPLVEALADLSLPVLATQPLPAPLQESVAEEQPGLAEVVRSADTVLPGVTTIDNVATYQGRVATVLAMAELPLGRTGQYGTGAGATRAVPEPAP